MTRAIAPLMIGLAGIAILLWLGTWQIQRLAWKEGVLAEIDARIGGRVQDIPPLAAVIPDRDRYTPVALVGDIGSAELFVLVSRKRVGAGYRVISPYTLNDGRRVLLDRGFIPTAARNTDRSRTDEAVEVLGNLHWPDDRNSSTPDNDVSGNTWFARDIDQMSAQLDTEPLLVVARRVSPADAGVTPLPVDTSGIPNDHLQYAVTWFSLAAVWAVMTALWTRRRLKEG